VVFEDKKGDRPKPRTERLAGIQFMKPAMRCQKHLLSDVVGVVRRVHSNRDTGPDAFLMQGHEFGKGLEIPGLGFADEF
jgi:hypothetical protein